MKVVHISGKRKKAIARATIKDGKGIVRINHNLLNNYNPIFARDKIMEPLILAGDIIKKMKIEVNVHGGGWRSQSEAIRLAIARAIVEFTQDKRIEKTFLDYDRQMLIADVRRKEQRKPNDSKARAKRQKSYR